MTKDKNRRKMLFADLFWLDRSKN